MKNYLIALCMFTSLIAYIVSANTAYRANLIECSEAMLELTAPETLREPIFEDFDSVEHYITAKRHFKLGGTWATLDNGFVCNLNK